MAMKTYMARPHELEPKWWLVDAKDKVVGRLASDIAMILMGKHRPTYTPHVDTGDFVVVVNADKVVFSGKKWEQKRYTWYTGYTRLRSETPANRLAAQAGEDSQRRRAAHAAEESAGGEDAGKAEGVCRRPASAPGAAAGADRAGGQEAPDQESQGPERRVVQLMATGSTVEGKGTNDILGTGRRKTSVARVRVRPGKGQIVVNERPMEEYFPVEQQRRAVLAPIVQSGKMGQVDILIRVHGGGPNGQADACKLGIARALIRFDHDAEAALRDAGLLTRDSRMKERKKYGLRGARRGTQFSKR